MEDEDKSDLSSLLEVNRLDYRLPPSLSIATSRSMKTFRSAKHDHVMGEDQVDFQLSSGAAYVDLLNSYLSFDIKFEGSGLTDVNMPAHAGWLNMIRGYRAIHSSGVELDRQNDAVGEWTQIQNYYHRSKDTRRTEGTLYRMNDSINPVPVSNQPGVYDVAKSNLADPGTVLEDAATPVNIAGKSYRAVIPLCQLAGIFDNDLLAPSFLTAGMRIELSFYSKDHFFIKPAGWGVDTTVLISKPEINLECFQLTDSITRKLSQISASSGLEWYWDANHHMSNVMAESSVTVQITRALSRANNIIVKSRSNTYVNQAQADSLASLPWIYDVEDSVAANDVSVAAEKGYSGNLAAFQVQLGAQYMPSQPIQHREDFLHSALKTFSQFRRSDEVGGVELPTFTGVKENQGVDAAAGATDKYSRYRPGLAIAAIPLESSSTLQQSGSAISAQRTAVVNLEFEHSPKKPYDISASPLSDLRRLDVFVQYSKLATLFLDSVVVRS